MSTLPQHIQILIVVAAYFFVIVGVVLFVGRLKRNTPKITNKPVRKHGKNKKAPTRP